MGIDNKLISSQSCLIIEQELTSLPFSLAYLHELILKSSFKYNMGAIMSEWLEVNTEFKYIATEASKIIKNLDDYNTDATSLNKFGENIKYNNLIQNCDEGFYVLQLNALWGQYYPIGSFQSSHCHLPCHWSFVFFVNCPKGSSPLVFGDNDLSFDPSPGKMLIFPSWIRHHVPHNDGEYRSIVAGNFMYLPKDLVEKCPSARIIYLS